MKDGDKVFRIIKAFDEHDRHEPVSKWGKTGLFLAELVDEALSVSTISQLGALRAAECTFDRSRFGGGQAPSQHCRVEKPSIIFAPSEIAWTSTIYTMYFIATSS